LGFGGASGGASTAAAPGWALVGGDAAGEEVMALAAIAIDT